jgi:TonB-dependent starch-binding outer membrane protein SusC
MKMKVYLSFLCLLLCGFAIAQKTVTGQVSKQGTTENLAGVTITVKGTSVRTSTNAEGRFSINVPAGSNTLVLSSVGYRNQEISIGDRTTITVSLQEESSTLTDVVVVGYQSVSRKNATAAISSIGAKELKDNPSNSAAEALAGRLAGVQVVASEGAPGADVDIFVRGRNSITQSGSPLYVVDGIQIENALSVLSPQDIESINVLKDAAATAIYGARGSNGVFIITTKGGKNTGGKTSVNYNGFAGFTQLGKSLDMMDPYEFVLWSYERAKYTENPSDTSVAAQYIKRMNNFDTIASTYKNYSQPFDWQKKVLGRSAFQTTHNISVTGGTAATQYNLSLTYNKQQGLIINSDYERKLASFRFDHKVSDKLKVGFNVRYNEQDIAGAGTSDVGGAGSNRLRQYTRYRPLIFPGQAEDYYDQTLDVTNNPGNGLNLVNPLLLLDAEYRVRKVTAYNFSGNFNYNFTKLVSFRSTFGYDVNRTASLSYDDTLTNVSRATNRQPLAGINHSDRKTINNSNVLTYNNPKLFNGNHALTVLIGQEIYQTDTKADGLQVNYFPIGTKPEQAFANLGLATPPAGVAQPKPTSSDVMVRQLSFFSSINYNYRQRYLLTLNFRADGSSLFGPNYSSPIALSDSTNRKWGYFPSASFAWRLSDEAFMQNVGFISDAKVRLSYGTAGNNRINAYGYTTGYAPPSNAGYGLNDVLNYTLTLPSRLGNSTIKWESLTSKNLGLDLTFLNNRVSLTADVYSNTTKNLLIDNKIPPTSGYTTQYQNVGTTRNNGVELQVGATVMKKKDFTWNTNFNISFNKNKIISLGDQKKFTANSGWFSSTANPDDYLLQVGDEIGTIYGLKVDGFYGVNDFVVTPYVNATNNARYPTLLYQYRLDPKLADPSKVLADLVAPGQVKYADINGDNKITLDSDRVVIGHALPKFTGGFSQQFAWKGFDASVFLNFSYGNDVFNANKLEFANAYGSDQNMLAINNDRWRVIDNAGNLVQKQIDATTAIGIAPEQLAALNANAKIWQPSRSTNGFAPSSFAVEDGSFLRINNITIGYNLPKALLQRVKISSLRVYATGYNIATITGYSGYDPEVNSRRNTPLTPGVDYAAYPRGRTFVFGVNLSL